MMIARIKSLYLQSPFAILFYFTLFTLAAGPVLMSLGFGRRTVMFVLGLNQALALVVSGKKYLVIGLIPLALSMAWVFILRHSAPQGAELVAPPVMIILAFLTFLVTFLRAIRTREVDAECIYAALSAYLFAGICMGITYWFIEQNLPGSFTFGGATLNDVPLATMLYFSFVTITTTGYGDILPISDIVRGLAVAEAIVGQLYLAAMLARLVSMYSAQR